MSKQPKGSGGGGAGGGGGSGGGPPAGGGLGHGTGKHHPAAPHKHGAKSPHKHLTPKELRHRRKLHEARVKTKAYQKKHAAALKHAAKLRKERKTRTAIGPRLGLQYVLGQNDVLDTCTATAVANSFYVATGILPDDDDVLRLFAQTVRSVEFDTSIEGTLRAVMAYGFMGVRPIITPVSRRTNRPGLILGVSHYPEAHTVVGLDRKWITWGGEVDACPICIDEVWHVGWLS